MKLILLTLLSCVGPVTEGDCWGVWNTDTPISMEQPATTNHRLKEVSDGDNSTDS